MSLFLDINNRKSSKRVGGFIAGGVVLLAFVADGFHWYDMNETVAQTIFIASASMIGAGIFERKTKEPGTPKHDETE